MVLWKTATTPKKEMNTALPTLKEQKQVKLYTFYLIEEEYFKHFFLLTNQNSGNFVACILFNLP